MHLNQPVPLAYSHLLEVMVTIYVLITPLALVPSLLWVAILIAPLVTLFFYGVYALYYFVSQAASRAKAEGELYYYLLLGVLGLIAVLPTAVVYKVRQAIRKRDGLAGQYCNCQPCCDGADCEDMLCAWLCNPCATCHLARHEGFANGEYGSCRPRGIPDAEEGLPA